MENKDLEKQGTKEVVEAGLFDNVGTSGFEGTSVATFKTPFLKILQALSPELNPSDPKFIKGAQRGLFCNTATQEICESIKVVVLKVEHSLITWKPNRGGFVGRVNKSKEETIVARYEGLAKWDHEGNDIMDTVEFFCMNADDPSDIFIISMSAASFKHGRAFATRLRDIKANGKKVNVTWAGIWKLSTAEEKNEKGAWFTIGSTPEFIRFVTKEERDKFIMPAKKRLENAVTDYSAIDTSESSTEGEEKF